MGNRFLHQNLGLVQVQGNSLDSETKEDRRLIPLQNLSDRQLALLQNLAGGMWLYGEIFLNSMISRFSSVARKLRKEQRREMADQVDIYREQIDEFRDLSVKDQMRLLKTLGVPMLMTDEKADGKSSKDQKDVKYESSVTSTADIVNQKDVKRTSSEVKAIFSRQTTDYKDEKDPKQKEASISSVGTSVASSMSTDGVLSKAKIPTPSATPVVATVNNSTNATVPSELDGDGWDNVTKDEIPRSLQPK